MIIGIVTIVDNNNYGNRLQNYALQEVVKKLGHDVVTFQNEIFLNEKKRWIYRKIKYFRFKGTYSLNENRKRNFQKFNEKSLILSLSIIKSLMKSPSKAWNLIEIFYKFHQNPKGEAGFSPLRFQR